MAKKTYKITIGTETAFVSLPDTYDAIASEVGFDAVLPSDIKVGQFVPKQQELIESGILFQLSVGFEGKKRGRILTSIDKLANRGALVDKQFNGKTIKSVSIRTYSKLV
jgi:hypothetical protein